MNAQNSTTAGSAAPLPSEPYRSPWMTPELDDWRRSVRHFFETEVAPHAEKWEAQQHVDKSIWRKAGELGMMSANIPEEYGGLGGNFAYEAVIVEEQARCADPSFGIIGSSVMGVPIFLAAATEEQRQRWLPRIAAGEAVVAFAGTEPNAGSDMKNISTLARREGDTYIINGQKTFITNGYNADLVILVARTGPAGRSGKGLSLFMIEPAITKGFVVSSNLKKIGQKGQDVAELFFDNMEVPAENLLGHVEGLAFAQLGKGFRTERTTIGLTAIATAERALELTIEHTKGRTAFEQPLFEFQNTRFKLAELATKVRIGRIFIDQCVQKTMDGTLDTMTAAMAKWWCSDLASEVTDACVQLHGGYGFMVEYPISKMWVDSRIPRIFGGANEIQKEVIARHL